MRDTVGLWVDLQAAVIHRRHSIDPGVIKGARFGDRAADRAGERHFAVGHGWIDLAAVDPDVPLETGLHVRGDFRVRAIGQIVDGDIVADLLDPFDTLAHPGGELFFLIGTNAASQCNNRVLDGNRHLVGYGRGILPQGGLNVLANICVRAGHRRHRDSVNHAEDASDALGDLDRALLGQEVIHRSRKRDDILAGADIHIIRKHALFVR